MPTRRTDGPALFAAGATALAVVAFAVTVAVAVASGPNGSDGATDHAPIDLDDGAVADPDADPEEVVTASATAMADVTSVQFQLQRSGAPVYIDQFESIALDAMLGQFTVPNRAQAQLTVTVDGNLTTYLGAIAIDDEVWISNPVTGDFETLPAGYDIDPSRFFDPEGGWQPLLANLYDVTMVGIEDDGGERYHVRGVAPAEQVQNITVGLVEDQDVPVDLWIHPGTMLVTRAEFDTVIDGAESHWALELERYGDNFTIEPPENVRD